MDRLVQLIFGTALPKRVSWGGRDTAPAAPSFGRGIAAGVIVLFVLRLASAALGGGDRQEKGREVGTERASSASTHAAAMPSNRSATTSCGGRCSRRWPRPTWQPSTAALSPSSRQPGRRCVGSWRYLAAGVPGREPLALQVAEAECNRAHQQALAAYQAAFQGQSVPNEEGAMAAEHRRALELAIQAFQDRAVGERGVLLLSCVFAFGSGEGGTLPPSSYFSSCCSCRLPSFLLSR